MQRAGDWARKFRAALLICAALLCSCQGAREALPKTHPAGGKVVVKGGSPVTAGQVEFRAMEGTRRTTLGQIEADGTFTLFTLAGNEKLPGALEGPHRVTVMGLPGADQAVATVELPTLYTVKPGEKNEFVITLDRPLTPPRR